MKNDRQFAIKEIISRKPVANQDDLRRELKRGGFKVTQATLSRDLREMGVIRVPGEGGSHYALQPVLNEMEILRPMMTSQVVSIRANESVIVIKTLPGCASVVGEFVDGLGNEDVIGTIAGDNTLLVIPSSVKKTSSLIAFMKNKLIKGVE